MSKNYNQPEGSVYQTTLKTESDAVFSPQANARLNTHESQNSTQTVQYKRPRKPSGNYKEYANTNESNPMKSQPALQPKTIEPAGMYSLQNSPVNFSRSPFRNAEEAHIKERYHNTLNQSNSFHKQLSYFTEFTSQNKGRMAEYRTDKSPVNGHSRYMSKPIFFTTVNTKNKLTEAATQDHSELLEVTRQTFSKSFRPGNTQSHFINEDSLNTNTNANDTKNETKSEKNKVLPNITKKRRNLSHIFTTEGNCTPIAASPIATQTKLNLKSRSPGKNDPNASKTANHFYTATSFNSRSLKNTLSVFEKHRNARPTRKEEMLTKLKNSQDLKNVSKYHTKDMAEVLMKELTEHSKIGPEEYLEHDMKVDNFRDASMNANMKKQEMKYNRDHSGSPKPYFEIREKEKYKESGALEDIGQFEENLRGWMKSVPNFGKQRWTYRKDWEYKLV